MGASRLVAFATQVSCISSNEAIRVNPVTNTVDTMNGAQVRTFIGTGASAYNYGDMTGHWFVLLDFRTGFPHKQAMPSTMPTQSIGGLFLFSLPEQAASWLAPPLRPRETGKRRSTLARARTGQPSLGRRLCRNSRPSSCRWGAFSREPAVSRSVCAAAVPLQLFAFFPPKSPRAPYLASPSHALGVDCVGVIGFVGTCSLCSDARGQQSGPAVRRV